jgi:hypothetical protein
MAQDEGQTVGDPPRYTKRAFPLYRFLPGRSPHPRRHPQGHSFEQPELQPHPFEPERWMTSEDYLYGIDLYNGSYWWEAHEVFEGFWHAYGRETTAGNFFQALIQCAAAHLKRELGNEPATSKLVVSGLARLRQTPVCYMGMQIATFAEDLTQWLNEHRPTVRIRLEWQGVQVATRGR